MNDSTDWFLRLTQSQKSFYFAGLGLIAGALSVGGWYLIHEEFGSSTSWIAFLFWGICSATLCLVSPTVVLAKERWTAIFQAVWAMVKAICVFFAFAYLPASASIQVVTESFDATSTVFMSAGLIFVGSVMGGMAFATWIFLSDVVPQDSDRNIRATVGTATSVGFLALVFVSGALALSSTGRPIESLAVTVAGCLLCYLATAVGLSLRDWPQPCQEKTVDGFSGGFGGGEEFGDVDLELRQQS